MGSTALYAPLGTYCIKFPPLLLRRAPFSQSCVLRYIEPSAGTLRWGYFLLVPKSSQKSHIGRSPLCTPLQSLTHSLLTVPACARPIVAQGDPLHPRPLQYISPIVY